MDPVTHALTGLGMASLRRQITFETTQEEMTRKALTWGSLLGATGPDIDIFFRLAGQLTYFKFHRGFSHSLPFVAVLAGLITLLLRKFYPGIKSSSVFLWTFAAALVHVFMDLLTTYSTQAFWPITSRFFSGNILMIIDPVILVLLFAGVIVGAFTFRKSRRKIWSFIFIIITFYIAGRGVIHYNIQNIVADYFDQKVKLQVTPGIIGVNRWNFVVETKDKYYLGEAEFLSKKVNVKHTLAKTPFNEVTEKALETKVGRVLSDFTPFLYVQYTYEKGNYIVKLIDLRFGYEDHVLSADLVLDDKLEVVETVFEPFTGRKN